MTNINRLKEKQKETYTLNTKTLEVFILYILFFVFIGM